MKKIISVLKNNLLFFDLSEDEIVSALKYVNAKEIRKEAREYILRVGDTTNSMGIVLSGTVFVIQEDIWGHRNIMSRVSAGDIFAECFAAVPGTKLNVSVVAESDCQILFFDIGKFFSANPDRPEFYNKITSNLVSVLARKTMTFNEKITHISKRTTRDKLLSFLSSESIRQGKLIFDIPYNRQQLADYLCVERAAMSVELSKLQNEGILSYNKNHFELKRVEEI